VEYSRRAFPFSGEMPARASRARLSRTQRRPRCAFGARRSTLWAWHGPLPANRSRPQRFGSTASSSRRPRSIISTAFGTSCRGSTRSGTGLRTTGRSAAGGRRPSRPPSGRDSRAGCRRPRPWEAPRRISSWLSWPARPMPSTSRTRPRFPPTSIRRSTAQSPRALRGRPASSHRESWMPTFPAPRRSWGMRPTRRTTRGASLSARWTTWRWSRRRAAWVPAWALGRPGISRSTCAMPRTWHS
jgi:hypothetical protein